MGYEFPRRDAGNDGFENAVRDRGSVARFGVALSNIRDGVLRQPALVPYCVCGNDARGAIHAHVAVYKHAIFAGIGVGHVVVVEQHHCKHFRAAMNHKGGVAFALVSGVRRVIKDVLLEVPKLVVAECSANAARPGFVVDGFVRSDKEARVDRR
tara:strand:+ start:305 stop:766 length:462 start_codon:yes stop_codon:yes gene_type:complete